MQRKQVTFIADSLDNAHRFQQVLSEMDVSVSAFSSAQIKRLLSARETSDLVIFELRHDSGEILSQIEQALVGESQSALLVIVPEDCLANFVLPAQIKSDFVVAGAGAAECAARIRNLLWPGSESSSQDFIVVEGMEINLATYQVQIGGKPLDLTYLEYALLAFLATHPGRTFSRDALLRRVWGFDYYGGSRTVDVHVRRVRAKLGPELAQHLETVRGVGYLWSV